LQVNAGSGHLAHGGQAGQGFSRGHVAWSGHFGHTGGTISDFKIYKSSLPSCMSDFAIPVLWCIPSSVG
tara:strand:+ start:5644 stop:5850 length:207 start_codon:yes stop_codon:yes gene_type:complete